MGEDWSILGHSLIMPIKHSGSQKAFESNLRRELERGKPMKQALAIAYSVQREAINKKRKKS